MHNISDQFSYYFLLFLFLFLHTECIGRRTIYFDWVASHGESPVFHYKTLCNKIHGPHLIFHNKFINVLEDFRGLETNFEKHIRCNLKIWKFSFEYAYYFIVLFPPASPPPKKIYLNEKTKILFIPYDSNMYNGVTQSVLNLVSCLVIAKHYEDNGLLPLVLCHFEVDLGIEDIDNWIPRRIYFVAATP